MQGSREEQAVEELKGQMNDGEQQKIIMGGANSRVRIENNEIEQCAKGRKKETLTKTAIVLKTIKKFI